MQSRVYFGTRHTFYYKIKSHIGTAKSLWQTPVGKA